MNPAPPTNPTNSNPTPTEGRDACGRFAKGNPGGPGNPYPRSMAALRKALLCAVTEEDIIAVTKAVIEEAKGGNMAAAKLLFHYVLGKPGAAADLDWDEERSMRESDIPSPPAVASPKANGSNGNMGEPRPAAAPKANGSNGGSPVPPAAPKANGSNGGSPVPPAVPAPSGLGRAADQWLDRQVSRAMEALGNEPLVKVV